MIINRIHKFVRFVYILSIVFIAFNVIGLNVVYLCVNFSGRYEQCWDCMLLKAWGLVLVGNVIVSVLAIVWDVMFEKFDNSAKIGKRHKGNV